MSAPATVSTQRLERHGGRAQQRRDELVQRQVHDEADDRDLDQRLGALPEALRAEHLLQPAERVEPLEVGLEQFGRHAQATLRGGADDGHREQCRSRAAPPRSRRPASAVLSRCSALSGSGSVTMPMHCRYSAWRLVDRVLGHHRDRHAGHEHAGPRADFRRAGDRAFPPGLPFLLLGGFFGLLPGHGSPPSGCVQHGEHRVDGLVGRASRSPAAAARSRWTRMTRVSRILAGKPRLKAFSAGAARDSRPSAMSVQNSTAMSGPAICSADTNISAEPGGQHRLNASQRQCAVERDRLVRLGEAAQHQLVGVGGEQQRGGQDVVEPAEHRRCPGSRTGRRRTRARSRRRRRCRLPADCRAANITAVRKPSAAPITICSTEQRDHVPGSTGRAAPVRPAVGSAAARWRPTAAP